MRQERTFKLVFLLLLSAVVGSAQDFHLTQYDGAPLYVNPGLTGLFQGKYRVCGAYRSQWSSITPNQYVTVGLSYDQKIRNKLAIGVQLMNERAGTGGYNVFGLNVNATYDYAFTRSKNHHLNTGINAGVLQKSVNISKLSFDEQYRYTNGGGFDSNVGSGEGAGQSILIPDAGAGVVYYYSNDMARVNPFLGVSAFHLNRPKESFFSSDNKLPVRSVLHGGFKVNLGNRFQLIPKALYMRQANANELSTSLIGHYYLEGSDSYLIFGPTWRNKDALIMEFGLKLNTFTYRVSYDVNYSTLQTATNHRGGFEFSIIYTSRKPAPQPVPTCPRL
jgi:type IX secretion system PorP/SprF family membrane protein